MKTLAGTVTLVASALLRFTVTPPAGAADGRVTANAADWPSPIDVETGTEIDNGPCTVTVAVVSAMLAALA